MPDPRDRHPGFVFVGDYPPQLPQAAADVLTTHPDLDVREIGARLRGVAGPVKPAQVDGICGSTAQFLLGADQPIHVCAVKAGHAGFHGHPNVPGLPWTWWGHRADTIKWADPQTKCGNPDDCTCSYGCDIP